MDFEAASGGTAGVAPLDALPTSASRANAILARTRRLAPNIRLLLMLMPAHSCSEVVTTVKARFTSYVPPTVVVPHDRIQTAM
jgi:hypothetical protein